MNKQRRLLEIDALRGIAAICVCLFHFSLAYPNRLLPLSYFKYGCTGVDLFFMISGFVIFMSINSSKSLKDFWVARFNRLFPDYWLSLIIALLSYYFLTNFEFKISFNYVIGNLFMVQPLFKTSYLVDAYWTLYVELCFYLFISIIYFFKQMDKIETIIWISLLMVVIVNSLYIYLNGRSAGYTRFYIIFRGIMPLISYLSFFASGILYYRVYDKGLNTNRVLLLIICFLITALIHSISGRFNLFFGTAERLICIFLFNILFILILNQKAKFLKGSLLIFSGTISYALYLVHESIGTSISLFLFERNLQLTGVIVGILASIIVAILITFLFEKKIHKLTLKKSSINHVHLIKTDSERMLEN